MATETAARIPREAREILRKRSFAHVATLLLDGSPRVTRAWVDLEGDVIVISMAEGQMMPGNLRNDPRVAIAAVDPDNPDDGVIVRGRVSEMHHDGAGDAVDAMAKSYLDADEYPFGDAGEHRVRVHIEPERVSMVPSEHGRRHLERLSLR